MKTSFDTLGKFRQVLLFTLTALCTTFHGLAVDLDPILRGTWPGFARSPAQGVAIAGNYAYVTAGYAGLLVVDISNPANPQRVGGYVTSDFANRVAVSGNYAYVADGFDGVQVIDITNPTNPRRVGGNTRLVGSGVLSAVTLLLGFLMVVKEVFR